MLDNKNPVGSFISLGQTLVSANEAFELGFFNPDVNEIDDVDANEIDDIDVNEDHAEKVNESLPKVNYNIFDVRVWDGLRSNMKDELVSKWPIRTTNLDYPKDKIEDTPGLGLFNVLQDVLKSLNLDIKYIRGQGYDNGSNMKGKHQVSKKLQSKDMLLDVSLKNLKGLVRYLEIYRESGLDNAISEAKQIAETLDIEPAFTIKRAPFDIALVQLNSRFKQMRYFESIFGFMFDASKLAYLDDANLKECCLNLESPLTNDEDCDIDGKDLFIELQIFQEMLPKGAYDGERPWSSIEIMEFTKKIDMFPNVLLACKILLTIPVMVASAEMSFSKLKILKSYLRSTMSQERLNGLANVM
ncbi:52 kDa repressor of the inhibitor of the protein kinase-like protein [Tanacetum coccineum]|uniref:52 kDa repressor of the inhibitor of the protein kinase-like protein n=1 Tax=Tanacetum coccineum TaxID=301880 RepID=A0ABQ5EH76_9ASTR